MYTEEIKQIVLSLDLKKEPAGVRFLLAKEEYDELNVMEFCRKKSACAYVIEAAEKGIHQKFNSEHVSCIGAMSALGLEQKENFIYSGKQFSSMRLYSSLAVAKKVTDELNFLDFRVYGFEIGPLKLMEYADVALILGNPWQMMRVIQGYTYYYAMPSNIGMAGNQGVCADLMARPFQKNDLNISMLCPGARIHMAANESDMGCGMPIQQFEMIAKAIIFTTSLTMTKQEKEKLLKRMDTPSDLDCEIELDKMYGTYLRQSRYPRESYNRYKI